MSPTIASLLGFAAWTLIVALIYVSWRGAAVLRGRAVDTFPADREHEGSTFYRRVWRAHLNCVENLPVYAAVTLSAAVLQRTGATDALALPFLGLRVAQSTIHMLSIRPWAIWLRLSAYGGQVAVIAVMLFRLASA